MALEDAVTLAQCLECAEISKDISEVLKTFQQIRQPRCKRIQEWSAEKGRRATLPDGLQQEYRDANLESHNAWVKSDPWDGFHIDDLPELESPLWKAWLCGHDAVEYVRLSCSTPTHVFEYLN
jgi:salicylate hydroxylase